MSGTFIVPSTSHESQKSYNRIVAWLTGVLTLLLALFSFILSFNALADLAANHGISIPMLFPLVVEASVVIFSLNALYRSTQGESAKWQWCLIIGSSMLAGAFNILHAQPDLVSRVMAAMPSLFLLLSFETFLGQIKLSVTRTNAVQSLVQLDTELDSKRQELDALIAEKTSEVERLSHEAGQLNATIVQAQARLTQLQQEIEQVKTVQSSSLARAQTVKAEQDALTIEQRRGRLVDILQTESGVGASALAERLNISRSTVYNDLKALSEAGVVNQNGQGWEVVQ